MNSHELLSQVPSQLQPAPWLKLIIDFIQEQTRVIHEQATTIQKQACIIQEQAEQITTLKKSVQELKDEITRLTNTPKRPKFRPGGGTPNDRSGAPGKASGSTGSNAAHKMVPPKEQQEVRVPAVGVPEGSRFKGYQTYIVQELEIIPKDITYKLEVWQSPDGTIVRASLPPEVQGSHFGYQLRALVHNLYAQGMTEPCIYELLIGSGIEISEGQVHNLLMSETDAYHEQSEKILTAGLEEAPYIRTDDTGEKHENKSVYSTHIGGQFLWVFKELV